MHAVVNIYHNTKCGAENSIYSRFRFSLCYTLYNLFATCRCNHLQRAYTSFDWLLWQYCHSDFFLWYIAICTMHALNGFCTKSVSVYYVSLPVAHQSFGIYNILFSQFILLTNQIIKMNFHVNTSLTQMGPCTGQTRKEKQKNSRDI